MNQQIRDFLRDRRKLIKLAGIVLILGLLPASLYLATHPIYWKSWATNENNISLYSGSNPVSLPMQTKPGGSFRFVIRDTKWR